MADLSTRAQKFLRHGSPEPEPKSSAPVSISSGQSTDFWPLGWGIHEPLGICNIEVTAKWRSIVENTLVVSPPSSPLFILQLTRRSFGPPSLRSLLSDDYHGLDTLLGPNSSGISRLRTSRSLSAPRDTGSISPDLASTPSTSPPQPPDTLDLQSHYFPGASTRDNPEETLGETTPLESTYEQALNHDPQKTEFKFEEVASSTQPKLAINSTWSGNSMWSGAGGGLVASAATCPLDVLKTKLQAQRAIQGQMGYQGIVATVKSIAKYNSFRGFYRGLGPTVLGYLPTWVIYFAVYDSIKSTLGKVPLGVGPAQGQDLDAEAKLKRERYVKHEHPWLLHILSAITAGATSTLCTNPLWVIKTRFMVGLNFFNDLVFLVYTVIWILYIRRPKQERKSGIAIRWTLFLRPTETKGLFRSIVVWFQAC
ncbi:hypothetical protein V5O48_003442 [Marasmius crinis-equi]|uniref:Uncharacterized protein n=1 Tax=Marasmius crinis-equi TaxID=585013 RepID=A0ABR3FTL9_9AGAR